MIMCLLSLTLFLSAGFSADCSTATVLSLDEFRECVNALVCTILTVSYPLLEHIFYK